jgi:hypothetical protein
MTLKAEGSDSGDFDGEFIKFRIDGTSDSGKTVIWAVDAKDGSVLGTVKWFGRWRKYCYFPEPNCVFEQTCLRDIAEFLDIVMKMHKEGV